MHIISLFHHYANAIFLIFLNANYVRPQKLDQNLTIGGIGIFMAITKIHPIKSTLNLAIDYIAKSEKTDEKILISSFKYPPSTANIKFMEIR